ncbi:voltage-dependent T-type calcium channel subunit alpha-1I-like [Micropterus dolomieu]|uniref:voltage-dependent T-type calcium channel subunit alpha-1I-like n=1 Tax=Micropterus dolomieu TaxID=147949 RepID=UPI001E8CC7AB|nr:voltage-dependent T-type calcium channel subunit alpha-1I-like [Micropterus dolomieu]
MALQHYNQPPYIGKITELSFYLVTFIMFIEVLQNLVQLGIREFIKISWNLLGVAVLVVSIVSIVLHQINMADIVPINPNILGVRKPVLKFTKLRILLKTIIKTLSQVGNICVIFMLSFYMYAAAGVELYGKLQCSDDHPCLGLHDEANFRHFGVALITLYGLFTGDNWKVIMKFRGYGSVCAGEPGGRIDHASAGGHQRGGRPAVSRGERPARSTQNKLQNVFINSLLF